MKISELIIKFFVDMISDDVGQSIVNQYIYVYENVVYYSHKIKTHVKRFFFFYLQINRHFIFIFSIGLLKLPKSIGKDNLSCSCFTI